MSISANEIKRVRSLSDKKFRDRYGLFCVEGEKMVDEALRSGFDVETVYRKDEIGEEQMGRISSLSSPSPVLAVVRKPQDINLSSDAALSGALGQSGLYLALDSIRDPGNLGTVIRDANALGIDELILSADCADLYNLKRQAAVGIFFTTRALIPFQIKYDQIHRFKAHFYFEILALRLLSGKRHTNLLYRIYAAKKSPAD